MVEGKRRKGKVVKDKRGRKGKKIRDKEKEGK